MPAPSRIHRDQVVAAARVLLERGDSALTMQAVAHEVGVRAPSLYKHVRDRDDLVGLIRDATIVDLTEGMLEIDAPSASDRIIAYARHVRAFVARWPLGSQLLFQRADAHSTRDLLQRAAAPVVRTCAELVGHPHALDAARTLTAWVYGFSRMEQADAFNLGHDTDRAFEFGLKTIVGTMTPTR